MKMLPRFEPSPLIEGLAVRLANWVLMNFTSERYQGLLDGTIQYGLAAAKRDAEEGRDAPTDWQEDA
ncbi:hypothetical protein [Brevibacterium pigmentatum]|uniref:hypothetical protein n=1 Tax=Brevibacterium pigmentatum TaxID=1496080 RepID=UPI001422AC43|nr:hypothetical protein [Brevibacterium pigmentatum]